VGGVLVIPIYEEVGTKEAQEADNEEAVIGDEASSELRLAGSRQIVAVRLGGS
jgi:hypothetical protein